MRRWWIVFTILLICVIGFEFWLLKRPKNNKIIPVNTSKLESNIKVNCEWQGKTYSIKEKFPIRFNEGCSLCSCEENYEITCVKSSCPED